VFASPVVPSHPVDAQMDASITHAHTHTHTCSHTYTRTHTHMHTHAHTHTHTHTQALTSSVACVCRPNSAAASRAQTASKGGAGKHSSGSSTERKADTRGSNRHCTECRCLCVCGLMCWWWWCGRSCWGGACVLAPTGMRGQDLWCGGIWCACLCLVEYESKDASLDFVCMYMSG